MREGKKIPKRKLNKWKSTEKLRTEEVIPCSGSSNGCFAPKFAHQSVPKSLLKVMQMSQAPTIAKLKYKQSGAKILQKADRRFQNETNATRCHLRHLRNSAKKEAHEAQQKQEHTDKVQVSRKKKVRPERVERKSKVKKMLTENRKWKMEMKKERRKAQLHAPKKGRQTEGSDSDEDELVDRTGYDEVAFGEVAKAPPRFNTIDKLIDKLRRRKVLGRGGLVDDEVEASDLLHLAP